MPGVAGEPTRHGKGVGPAMYSGHAWEGGQRATFNYGSGVLCIAHRLLLSLFARQALSSDHRLTSDSQTFSSPQQTFSRHSLQDEKRQLGLAIRNENHWDDGSGN